MLNCDRREKEADRMFNIFFNFFLIICGIFAVVLFICMLLVSCSTFKPYIEEYNVRDYKPTVDSICRANNLSVPRDTTFEDIYTTDGRALHKQRLVTYKVGKRLYSIIVLDTDTIDNVQLKVE